MRRRLIAYGVCLLAALAPALGWVEDEGTLALARTLYAACWRQADETLYAYADTIRNRIGREEFGDTLIAVLSQFGQYPKGSRYDERTLKAARAVVSGEAEWERIPGDVVYAVPKTDSQKPYETLGFWRISGDYVLYRARP